MVEPQAYTLVVLGSNPSSRTNKLLWFVREELPNRGLRSTLGGGAATQVVLRALFQLGTTTLINCLAWAISSSG